MNLFAAKIMENPCYAILKQGKVFFFGQKESPVFSPGFLKTANLNIFTVAMFVLLTTATRAWIIPSYFFF